MRAGPGRAAATIVTIVAITSVVVGAFGEPPGGWKPPLVRGGGPIVLNGTAFTYESEELFGESNGWLNYTYGTVLFEFHLWCGITVDVGYVCGNVTQPNGVRYAFTFADGLPRLGPAPWQSRVSPDLASAVEYQQGGTARLLIEE